MKISSITIRNFQAIAEERVELNGASVWVIGKNGAGKSSFIDAIFKTLKGGAKIEKPIKEGERKGEVEITLSDMEGQIIVRHVHTKKESILTLETPEGSVFASPRTMLNDLVKPKTFDFDISEFLKLSMAKQVEFMKGLTGIDFTDYDEKYKEAFEERTVINRELKLLAANAKFFDKKVAEQELIDVSMVAESIQKAEASNKQIEEVNNRTNSRKEENARLQAEIAELEILIQTKRAKIQENEDKIAKASGWLLTTSVVDTSKLLTEMSNASAINASIHAAREARTQHERMLDLDNQVRQLELTLQSILDAKNHQLQTAKLPGGLKFDGEGLSLNGIPLEQVNTAQKIIMGLQINKELLGEIKIARLEGSLLDNDNLGKVQKWADENGLQLFVELVDRNTEGLKLEIKEAEK